MFNTKTALFALAGMASVQTMAAPLADGFEIPSHQLSQRDSVPASNASLFSSAFDINLCAWSSGIFFVSWAILMKQFDDKTIPEMYSAVDAALKANSATASYTWQEKQKQGIGADNTTLVLNFNTDDFATANTMSNLLNKLTGTSGNSGFKCMSTSAIAGADPDLSSLLAELSGTDGTEEPSDPEKRSLGSGKSTKTSTATSSTKTSAAATSTATSASQSTATGNGNTAHPSGLAELSKATNIDGLSIPALSEMAAKAGLPSTASRYEVIEKLDELAA